MLQVVHASPELVPEPAVLTVIKDEHGRDLRTWFTPEALGEWHDGAFGAQLERVERYAFKAKPCVRCGGDKVRHTGGCGFVASSRKYREANDREREMLEMIGISLPTNMLPPRADRVCKKCKGRGWIVPTRPSRISTSAKAITARPTGSSKYGSAPTVTVDCTEIDRMGRIGRWLKALELEAPDCHEVLRAWFGTPRKLGGLTKRALWHLTPAGNTLLRRNHLHLAPRDFFQAEHTAELERSNANRRQLMLAADEQAADLWQTACGFWNLIAERPLVARPLRPLRAVRP